jgi:isopropylmalate/homocitrate/citramalate synthase
LISRGTAFFRPLSTLVTDCYKGISGGCLRREYARPMQVLLCDVGPRDGLQNEPEVLPPETRAELVDRLAAAGLRRIEAVSFVRADRVPQMAGAEDVIDRVHRREGFELTGLVLNERGWERFAAAGLDRVNVTFAATETFNLRNGNATLAEASESAEVILGAAGETPARVTISCSFGCPFEGRVDPGVVADLAARFAERAEVVLADTIGVATPSAVRALVERAGAAGFHGHNTRNTGYANCLAALEAGAHVLDASVGGLGGCPFSPRATGNVATEDLVYLLEGEGVETGIDLDALVGVSRWLEEVLGRTLEGYVYRAGSWPTGAASGGRRPGTSSGRS